jgi:hypothetical protein
MVDWEEIKRAFGLVKQAKEQGLPLTVKISCGKVYSMGSNNPVIRIDIKESEENNYGK